MTATRPWLAGLAARPGRYLLPVAVLFSGVYAAQALTDIARPRADFSEPVVGLLAGYWPAAVRATFWAVLVSWLVVAAGWAAVTGYRWRTGSPPLPGAVLRLAVAVVLLLPFTIFPVGIILGAPLVLLVCLPSTAFGLWAVRRLQRYRKIPGWLLLAVFGWGALVATGFGGANNLWVMDYAPRFLFSAGNLQQVGHDVNTAMYASAGIFEELGKGAGVALAYLLFRRYVDDVVAGVALGAAAGLGFNLTESVEYISSSPNSAEFQYWMRQSVGLMGAHTAFTAVIGAGFGIARQLHTTQARALAVTAGYLGGAGAHFANDALLRFWGQVEPRTFGAAHPILDQILVQPLALAVLQGPFVVLYLLLRRRGTREQAAGLADALGEEVATRAGAVTAGEVPILLSPARRLRLRLRTLHQDGYPAARVLVRMQNAQYDLAVQRWHQALGDEPEGPAGDELREQVHAARRQLSHRLTPTPAQVPA